MKLKMFLHFSDFVRGDCWLYFVFVSISLYFSVFLFDVFVYFFLFFTPVLRNSLQFYAVFTDADSLFFYEVKNNIPALQWLHGWWLHSKTGRDRSRHLRLWLVNRRDRSWFWRPVVKLQRGPGDVCFPKDLLFDRMTVNQITAEFGVLGGMSPPVWRG